MAIYRRHEFTISVAVTARTREILRNHSAIYGRSMSSIVRSILEDALLTGPERFDTLNITRKLEKLANYDEKVESHLTQRRRRFELWVGKRLENIATWKPTRREKFEAYVETCRANYESMLSAELAESEAKRAALLARLREIKAESIPHSGPEKVIDEEKL